MPETGSLVWSRLAMPIKSGSDSHRQNLESKDNLRGPLNLVFGWPERGLY